jgi:hypothetical protein
MGAIGSAERMEDIEELLEDARRGIEEIQRMHTESVAAGEIVPGMRARIKSVLEHQRSVLDYLVNQVNAKYCKKPPKNRAFDVNMPGVRKLHPEIAAAFEVHQPHISEWLQWLHVLVNGNKHNQLTPQSQQTQDRWSSGNISVQGISFMVVGQEPTTDPREFFDVPTPWTKETITEWRFVKPSVPVVMALSLIQQGVGEVVRDVRQAAGL